MRRTHLGGSALAMAAGLVAVAASPALSQYEGPADGDWHGVLVYDGTATYDTPEGDLTFDMEADGSFDLASTAGTVSGTYTVVVGADLPELGGHAVSVATGTIEGPAVEPRMVFERIDVQTEAAGVELNIGFTAAELGNPVSTMIIRSSSCDMMSGDWNQEFGEGLAAQGGSTSAVSGQFVAFRMESLLNGDPAWSQALAQGIINRGQFLLADIRAGDLSPSSLRDFLDESEGLIRSGTRRTGCADGATSSSRFQSLALVAVQDVLGEMALRIDGVSDRDLFDLIVAGYRTGAFDADPDLAGFYDAEFESRVDDALATGDRDTLIALAAASRQLGRNELADMILETL